jgi:hypothetical protein
VLLAVAPGPWEGRGLALVVPPGWSGTEGPSSSPLVLSLEREGGPSIEIWEFPRSSAVPNPRPREGCERLFDDTGVYVSIPGLRVEHISTCLPADPTQPVVQGWYAVDGDREVHVEVEFPPGRLVEGRREVDPILQSLGSAEAGRDSP